MIEENNNIIDLLQKIILLFYIATSIIERMCQLNIIIYDIKKVIAVI